jgi:hypothetical protein
MRTYGVSTQKINQAYSLGYELGLKLRRLIPLAELPKIQERYKNRSVHK